MNIISLDWKTIFLGENYKRPMTSAWYLRKAILIFLKSTVTKLTDIPFEKNCIYCFKSIDREDYESIWNKITDAIPQKKLKIVISQKKANKIILFKRINAIKIGLKLASKFEFSFYHRVYIAAKSIYYIELLDKISHIKPKAVLVFAEMRPLENLIVQYFNKLNVPTISLQHGLFIYYKNQFTINRINYESSKARFFLAWGEETRDLIKMYNENSEIVICGAPQLMKVVNEDTFLITINVILDGDINRLQNQHMIDIGKKMAKYQNRKLLIHPHPRTNLSLYNLPSQCLSERKPTCVRSSIIMGHTTTELIKLARIGFRVYKYRSNQPSNKGIPESIQFDSFEELLVVMDDTYPKNWAEFLIKYIDNDSYIQYCSFFEQICKNV